MGTPKDYEYALLCDGSEISASDYGDLVAMIGDRLPNLTDNRFLEGSTTAGEYKSAGLPNVEGHFSARAGTVGASVAIGPFTTFTAGGQTYANQQSSVIAIDDIIQFSASKSNAIYGNSTTVQPQSMTVKYYICYA